MQIDTGTKILCRSIGLGHRLRIYYVKFLVKLFLFPNQMMNLIYILYDDKGPKLHTVLSRLLHDLIVNVTEFRILLS